MTNKKRDYKKRLWAPWRLEYVQRVRKGGCFLCDIIKDKNNERQNLVVSRGKTAFLLINRYPYNNGHLLVAPYRHIELMGDLTDTELLELMKQASRGCDLLKNVIKAEGFNVGLNLGTVAGAGLKEHLHLHIVPRWAGDTNFMPVLTDVKVIPQHLDDLWHKLREEANRSSST